MISRPKLTALLNDDSWGTLVVERKDRLSRVGFGWFAVLLGISGRRTDRVVSALALGQSTTGAVAG
jgi:hypothetical protein